MPPKFGNVTKAFCAADGQLDDNSPASILASTSLNEFSKLVQDLQADGKNTDEQIKKFLNFYQIKNQI